MAYVCTLPLSPAHASYSGSSSPAARAILYPNAGCTIGRPSKYTGTKSPYFFGCSHGKDLNLLRRGLLKGIGTTGILMCASVISEPSVQGMEKLPFKPEGYSFWTWRNHKIHYVVQGEGRPIVLIHGFGASAFHWRYNIPKLAKTFKVYAIDLLGFGWSEKAIIDYNAFVWRDQVADFLKEIVKDPAILVGNRFAINDYSGYMHFSWTEWSGSLINTHYILSLTMTNGRIYIYFVTCDFWNN